MKKKRGDLSHDFGERIEEIIERAMRKINERIDECTIIMREFPLE